MYFLNINNFAKSHSSKSYILAQIYQNIHKNSDKPLIIFSFDTQDLEMSKREKFDNPQTLFTFGIQDLETGKTRKEPL